MRPNRSPYPFASCPSEGLSLAVVHRLRERSVRDTHGLFLASGVRFLARCFEQNWPIAGLVVCPRLLTSPHGNTLVRTLVGHGVPRRKVGVEEFREILGVCATDELEERLQGVIVVAEQRWDPLPETISTAELWLGVEFIRSPGNLGTLLRTCEGVGVTRVVVFDRSSDGSPFGLDPFDPACVRASMGSIFAHTFTRTTHQEFRAWACGVDIRVIGASGDGQKDFREANYLAPTMLMLGDERKGLSPGQRGTCHSLVRIPMSGCADSLNVAIAGALVLYEAYRQRNPLEQSPSAILAP